ncbi:cupredoxin domain-containing protein [Candidatus Nitrosotenuis aquarius]|uniref:cupredoxin domain-containing protein n=1 Tax=Candidatus Nitrosotenuis aquarius TaxID=1846278 RepID=UPI000C1E4983|nr:plastocyanin/azurin family copper-binding protein [Candidatus Nitrosotenuis aquarius]
MNTKLLASFAVFVLLAAVVSVSMTNSAFAAEDKKAEMKAKKDDKKTAIKEKKDTKKAEMKAKKDDKKTAIKEKKDTKKAEMKAKKDTATGQTSAKAAPSGEALKEVTVDMAKGTASDTNCGDKCYLPSTVAVTVGGKVTWKNVDSAAHTATASDGSFDTSLVNAGASASNTFNTAGSYPYMCILHPWMKGTVTVQ